MRLYTLPIGVLALLLMAVPALAGNSLAGKVRAIEDGDTLTVSSKGRWIDVNLAGVKAPTRGQDLGPEAREFLEQLASKKKVRVEVVKKARNGTAIANVTLEDGRDLATAMIEAGYAWATSDATEEQRSAAKRAQASAVGIYGSSASATTTGAGR